MSRQPSEPREAEDGESRDRYRLVDWGLTDYGRSYERQKEIFSRRLEGDGRDTLVVTRHQPTVTTGKSASEEDILVSREELRERGVDLVETGRGGGVTYHDPGQLVLYPLFDLRDYGKDLRGFVRRLGAVLQGTAEEFGLKTVFREDERIGLWVEGEREKLASIGLRIKRWHTMHGVALNVDVDREKAGLIRPCGVSDSRLVSLADYADLELAEVKSVLLEKFESQFSRGGER